jgi:hypothetical protein
VIITRIKLIKSYPAAKFAAGCMLASTHPHFPRAHDIARTHTARTLLSPPVNVMTSQAHSRDQLTPLPAYKSRAHCQFTHSDSREHIRASTAYDYDSALRYDTGIAIRPRQHLTTPASCITGILTLAILGIDTGPGRWPAPSRPNGSRRSGIIIITPRHRPPVSPLTARRSRTMSAPNA